MGVVATHRFRSATAACPARVWAVLTSPGCLYGVTVVSTWSEGADVALACPGAARAAGRVLHACPPTRLTFSVDDPSGEATLVTWEVRERAGGSIVRLFVDDTSPTVEAEAEDIWLPILSKLTDVVRA